jgi:excisionase family DNA binding protein
MDGRFEIGQVMTSRELAEYLNIQVTTLARLVRRGKIPAFKVAEHWRFRADLVDDWTRQIQRSKRSCDMALCSGDERLAHSKGG